MNKKLIIILISIIVGIGMIVGAFILSSKDKSVGTFDSSTSESKETNSSQQNVISKDELAKANGKDGNDCYVAVDGTVYLIEDFSLWSDGQHTSSNGQAYCGADMTAVIDKAPHGRSKLNLLTKVGTLEGQ